jgi:hypothetical protein
MDMRRYTLCDQVTRDIEVVTARAALGYVTVIHNGPLDGERFESATLLGALFQHKHAMELAAIAATESPPAAAAAAAFFAPRPVARRLRAEGRARALVR